ncbi:MAG TPA: response regulator transcription factor [Burkholderiaceae bacterium]|nr:response regulator transcription factor [Burkholderiaceae bacterium]
MKVLLVEDDAAIGEGVVLGLTASGLTVDWVTTGGQALAALANPAYSVVVLDLGLPDMDGLDLLGRARRQGALPPVLILSARNQPQHRVAGLNLGADDYLVKPFDFDELVARLHALHRRRLPSQGAQFSLADLTVDPLQREATLAGTPLALSPKEFNLLAALIEQPGVVRSLPWLEDRLYAWGEEVASNAVQVHLHNLRRKLGEGWVHNIRGVGYKLARPPAPELPDD